MRIFLIITMVLSLLVSSAQAADWRSEIGVFRVGLPPDLESQAEPFRLALEDALGMEVEFYAGKSTEKLIDAIRTDKIEYAIFSASAFAFAWSLCECVEPIATSRSNDSTDSYYAILISGPNGPESLKDLKGKTIGELSPGSISQTLLIKYLIAQEGVDLDTVTFVSAASGMETLADFTAGKIDALIGWSSLTGEPVNGYTRGTLHQISTLDLGNPEDFQIIWQSPRLPQRTHAIRKRLPGETKNIIRDFLFNLYDRDPVAYDSIEPVYGGGFANTRLGLYKPYTDYFDSILPNNKTRDKNVDTFAQPE